MDKLGPAFFGGLVVGAVSVGAWAGNKMSMPSTAPDSRFGSKWHQDRHMHQTPSIAKVVSGGTSGQVAHVRAVIPEVGHVKVFGHVCDTCGYVNVNSTMDLDSKVETEIFDRPTFGYTWTTLDQVDETRIE
jgi:hypothetical protein